jgi:hypothetical protein
VPFYYLSLGGKNQEVMCFAESVTVVSADLSKYVTFLDQQERFNCEYKIYKGHWYSGVKLGLCPECAWFEARPHHWMS